MRNVWKGAAIGTGLALVACAPMTEEIEIVVNQNTQQHALQAVLYHQTAGEYKALCYQTFNLAKGQLERQLANHAFPYEKSPAVVMDLDETVVDNSFYNAQLILEDHGYSSESWKKWSAQENAGEVPGALDFIRFAREKGVKVIFISNRRVSELTHTMENLKKLGLTEVSEDDFYLRTDEGSKKARRMKVRESYEILQLFGDNLADFTELFDKQSMADRNALVDSLHTRFGENYFVLPNVIYGEWEGALTNYNRELDALAQDSIKKGLLKGF